MVRTWLNGTLFSYLPTDLQAVISSKSLQRSIGNTSTTLQTATDKLWIPTEYEMLGAIDRSASTEAAVQKHYSLFSSNALRIKPFGLNGSGTYWWMSSPWIAANNGFCSIGPDGTSAPNEASAEIGIPLCFTIIPE